MTIYRILLGKQPVKADENENRASKSKDQPSGPKRNLFVSCTAVSSGRKETLIEYCHQPKRYSYDDRQKSSA